MARLLAPTEDYKFKAIVGFLPSDNFYIDKCINHLDKLGELVACSSPDFLSTKKDRLYKMGTITDLIDTADGHVIWRFVREDYSRKTLVNNSWKHFTFFNDKLMFLKNEYTVPFTDLFTIHVGAISGLDEAFVSEKGNVEFVTSQTPQSDKTKRMFFNCFDKSMEKHKKKLLARKIKKFSEDNWWMWGRSHYISNQPRVYVPCKTRQSAPFFHHDSIHYDGTILAIFYTGKAKPAKVVNLLNKVDWEELGFKVGKRFIFSQKSLENVRLPKDFLTIGT